MDKAYHYYCIHFLSEMAGFPAKDAQTIAYASQYVDDATEHKAFKIAGVPDSINYPRYNGTLFNPICTAHSAKSLYKKLRKWAKFYIRSNVQRKILMVFHFIPPMAVQDYNPQDEFDFITQKDSKLANELLDNALKFLKGTNPGTDEYEFGLIKTGIALHTYADTWAHCGFSGRHNPFENDIKDIRTKRGNKFSSVNVWEDFVSYAAPDVGHAEANTIPDRINIHWKATYSDRKRKPRAINRDNPSNFLAASRNIHTKLSAVAPNKPQAWKTFEGELRSAIGNNETLENYFPNVSFPYSCIKWRAESLCGDTVDWDDFDDASDFAKLNLKWTGNDLKWFKFHMAAFEQRNYLATRIPNAWLVES